MLIAVFLISGSSAFSEGFQGLQSKKIMNADIAIENLRMINRQGEVVPAVHPFRAFGAQFDIANYGQTRVGGLMVRIDGLMEEVSMAYFHDDALAPGQRYTHKTDTSALRLEEGVFPVTVSVALSTGFEDTADENNLARAAFIVSLKDPEDLKGPVVEKAAAKIAVVEKPDIEEPVIAKAAPGTPPVAKLAVKKPVMEKKAAPKVEAEAPAPQALKAEVREKVAVKAEAAEKKAAPKNEPAVQAEKTAAPEVKGKQAEAASAPKPEAKAAPVAPPAAPKEEVKVETAPKVPAETAYTDVAIGNLSMVDAGGNLIKQAAVGQRFGIRVDIQNIGQAPVAGVILHIRNLHGGLFTHPHTQPLAPGEGFTYITPSDKLTSRHIPVTFPVLAAVALPPGYADTDPGNNQAGRALVVARPAPEPNKH